jgi:hypothetical protein
MPLRVEQKPARIAPTSSAPELMKHSEQEEFDTITLSHASAPAGAGAGRFGRLPPQLERKT